MVDILSIVELYMDMVYATRSAVPFVSCCLVYCCTCLLCGNEITKVLLVLGCGIENVSSNSNVDPVTEELVSSDDSDDYIFSNCASSIVADGKEFESLTENDTDGSWTVVTRKNKNKKPNEMSSFY
jgi:hypothetical protein